MKGGNGMPPAVVIALIVVLVGVIGAIAFKFMPEITGKGLAKMDNEAMKKAWAANNGSRGPQGAGAPGTGAPASAPVPR